MPLRHRPLRRRPLRRWPLGALCLLATICLSNCGIVAEPDADGGPPLDTVVRIDDFDRACTVDADCVAGLVGDVCACGCDWAGFAARDRVRFDQAWLRTYMACAAPPDCAACAEPFVWCDAGVCAARVGPAACGCPGGTVCVQRYDGRCGGGSPVCIEAPAGCAAQSDVPIGRRVCAPDCEATLCGAAGTSCRGACGGGAEQVERPFAVQCYGF